MTQTVTAVKIERVPGMMARFALVLPLAFITYSIAYLDRVNIGFSLAGGMGATLKLGADGATWFNSIFYLGYVLFQIPGTSYAAKKSVRHLMFWSLFFWGIVASLTAFLHDFKLLLLDRFLLGAVEGVVFPSLLVFLTHWFTKRERSRANTILILGNPLTMLWASVLSTRLIEYFDAHPLFAFQGWQIMLLAEGAPTIVWAVLWWLLARDRPSQAAWLSPQTAIAVESALNAEQKNVKLVKDYRAAFRDRQVILFCVQFFAWSVGIYGLNMWLPVIMKDGSKLGIGRIGLWNALPYLCGVVAMLVVAYISDRTLKRKRFVWPFLFIGAAAFLFSYLAGPSHFWIAFIGLVVAAACMYAPYGPFWAMVPEMVSRNVIGESLALINTIGAAGGFIGTFGVGKLHHLTGGYGSSFACLSVCLLASGLLTLAIHTRNE